MDVFAEATRYLGAEPGYRIMLLAETRELQRTSSGMGLLPDARFDDIDGTFDIILVARGPSLPGSDPSSTSDQLWGSATKARIWSTMKPYVEATAVDGA